MIQDTLKLRTHSISFHRWIEVEHVKVCKQMRFFSESWMSGAAQLEASTLFRGILRQMCRVERCVTTFSLGLKGKSTGNHGFYHETCFFSVDFPFNQSNHVLLARTKYKTMVCPSPMVESYKDYSCLIEMKPHAPRFFFY